MTSEVSNAHQTLARGSAESKRLAAKGHKAVAVVLTMKKRIERSFYAMGKALVVLEGAVLADLAGGWTMTIVDDPKTEVTGDASRAR